MAGEQLREDRILPYDFSGRKKKTDVDRILHYLKVGTDEAMSELSDRDKDKMERIMFAERQLARHFKKGEVVELLRDRFKDPQTQKKFTVGHAYRIIRDTERILGEVGKINPDFLAVQARDIIMDTIRLANEKGDVRGLNAATKNLLELIKMHSDGAGQLPEDLLDRIDTRFSVNPTLLGIEPTSVAEMSRLLEELKQPRVLDITDEQNQ